MSLIKFNFLTDLLKSNKKFDLIETKIGISIKDQSDDVHISCMVTVTKSNNVSLEDVAIIDNTLTTK